MEEIKKYLKETLGVEFEIERFKPNQLKALPIFIKELYSFYKVRLFGRSVILLKNRNDETLTVDSIRKHLEIVENAMDTHVVFAFNFLQSYNRRRLIEKKIPFFVPGKQMFIPQFFIDLREFRQTAPDRKEKLLPAAQCVLFYHILKENLESFPLKTLAEKLNYTQATITRAAQSLEDHKLVEKIKENKEVKIRFKKKRYDLWKEALPVLQYPVKKVYILKEPPKGDIVYDASFSALSYYTDLAEGDKKYFAVAEKDFQILKKKRIIQIIQAEEGEIQLEVWKYAPGFLAENGVVDPLSLFLTLRDIKDERIEMEMEKMLKEIW